MEKLMTQFADVSAENTEIQRLKVLIPSKLRSQVVVARSSRARPKLITSEKLDKQRSAIAIDLIQWEQLPANQRDLLFWHEIARIQNDTVGRFPWEWSVFTAAIGMALTEVAAQNLLFLAIALVVAGLSGNQLYQRNRGERALREATTADQGAIFLALQSGYSFAEATLSLRQAIQQLGRQAVRRAKTQYKVRLQVLEIFVASHTAPLRELAPAQGVELFDRMPQYYRESNVKSEVLQHLKLS